MLSTVSCPSRRSVSRVDSPEGVWVVCRSRDREMVSLVRNVSSGGIFVESKFPIPIGSKADVSFLVPEGEITAEADVRHAEPGRGMGLKLTAIRDMDRPRMVNLIRRLRSFSPRG